jgi:hypothetical protein
VIQVVVTKQLEAQFTVGGSATGGSSGGAGSGGSIMPLLVRKDNLLDVNARGRNWADIWTDQLSAKSKGKMYSYKPDFGS